MVTSLIARAAQGDDASGLDGRAMATSGAATPADRFPPPEDEFKPFDRRYRTVAEAMRMHFPRPRDATASTPRVVTDGWQQHPWRRLHVSGPASRCGAGGAFIWEPRAGARAGGARGRGGSEGIDEQRPRDSRASTREPSSSEDVQRQRRRRLINDYQEKCRRRYQQQEEEEQKRRREIQQSLQQQRRRRAQQQQQYFKQRRRMQQQQLQQERQEHRRRQQEKEEEQKRFLQYWQHVQHFKQLLQQRCNALGYPCVRESHGEKLQGEPLR